MVLPHDMLVQHTKKTHLSLVFGTEAVIPVEFRLLSFRVRTFDKNSNKGTMRAKLDLLEEKRLGAEMKMHFKFQDE